MGIMSNVRKHFLFLKEKKECVHMLEDEDIEMDQVLAGMAWSLHCKYQ